MSNLKERITQHLIDHQGYFKYILEPHTKTKDQYLNDHPVFYDEICNDYNNLAKSLIVNEVCKGLATNYVDVITVIEEIDLSKYLKV